MLAIGCYYATKSLAGRVPGKKVDVFRGWGVVYLREKCNFAVAQITRWWM